MYMTFFGMKLTIFFKNEEEMGDFVVCYYFLYEHVLILDVGFSRMRTT